ncbi:hypothetical protein [Kitasatospora sp. NPDC093806]|uniref:hypothetical protein n=1 Tax=Kitasatospora sp. NPDC093806 TaxID=3155075 RepID=UPI00343F3BB6
MADEAGGADGSDGPDDGERVPMVWALAVREAADGPPFAEVIVEIGPRLYRDFAEAALDSGFVLAAGPVPATTAVVQVRGATLARLVLVGGRQVWEPASEVALSPGWRAAAEGRRGAVVLVVPPGTWPAGLMELDPGEGAATFTRSLEQARTAGHVLHGLATLDTAP